MLRNVILALAISSAALATTACNTVQGAGKDIESVGKEAEKQM